MSASASFVRAVPEPVHQPTGWHGHKHNGCLLPYLPMEQVEADVERFWNRVRNSRKDLDAIRVDLSDLIRLAASQHQDEMADQRDRLARLEAEEHKLLQAHYAQAVSLSLLQKQQKRILGERAAAEGLVVALSMEYQAMERTLDQALARVENCADVYRAGGPRVRRELCFGFFKRMFIAEEGVSGADLHTLYAEILSPEIGEQIKRELEAVTAGEFRRPGWGQSEGRAIQENGPRATLAPLERPQGPMAWGSKNPPTGTGFQTSLQAWSGEPTPRAQGAGTLAESRHGPARSGEPGRGGSGVPPGGRAGSDRRGG